MSATYAFRAGIGGDIERMSSFGIPTPMHAQTPAAEAAREAMRESGRRNRRARLAAELVTDHGNPRIEPYPHPRPDAATRLVKLAASKGWTTNVFETPGNVRTVVEGIRGSVAFRATWHRGRAESATWHEQTTRYALIDDARPVGVSKLTRVALAKHRGAGLGTTHLAIVASPVGISIGRFGLSRRLAETSS